MEIKMESSEIGVQIGTEKVYPGLENLIITPSEEEQHFKSEKYGYDNVTVKKIESDAIIVQPTTDEQTFDGLYNRVIVNKIETEEKVTILDFSNTDAIEVAPTEGKYLKKIIINKDENKVPENIAKDVVIDGVKGNFEGGTDTTDATATADDIIAPKTAYVNGEKVIGNIIPTYENVSHIIEHITINRSSDIAMCTEDGKCIVIWYGTTLYTYVLNEETGVYDFKNSYAESNLNIKGDLTSYTKQLDIGAYVENKICYVVVHRYKNGITVICLNAETGVLGYKENGYFGSYKYNPKYVEPCYAVAFSNKRGDIYVTNHNNGFSNIISSLMQINKSGSVSTLQTWSQNTNYMYFTADDNYFIAGNTLYKNNNYTTMTAIKTFSEQTCINSKNNMAVCGGKLYAVSDMGTDLLLDSQLSDISFETIGGWINDKIYVGISDTTLNIYDFIDLDNIQTYTYLNVNRYYPRHYSRLVFSQGLSLVYVFKESDGEQLINSLIIKGHKYVYVKGT